MTVVDNTPKSNTIAMPTSPIRQYAQGNPMRTTLPAYVPPINLASRVKYTMDNTGDSVNTKNFYMFDPVGAVKSIIGVDTVGTAATPSQLTNAIIGVNIYIFQISTWNITIRFGCVSIRATVSVKIDRKIFCHYN
jgi:S-formylglutathione hydrolase FrmB